MRFVWFLILVPVLLVAETAAPKIPDSVRASFWKAQAQMLSLQSAFDRANAEMNSVREAMAKACGEKATPYIKPDGEPDCQVKPKPEVVKPQSESEKK